MKLFLNTVCCAIALLIFHVPGIVNGQDVVVLPENSTVGTLDFGCAPDTEPTILYQGGCQYNYGNIDVKMRIVNDESGGQFVFVKRKLNTFPLLTLPPGETNIELVFLGTTSGSFGATVEIFDFAADELTDEPVSNNRTFYRLWRTHESVGLGRFHP